MIAKIDQQKRYLKILIGSPINEALFLDNYGLEDINLPVDLEREQLQILNIKEVEVLNKQKKIEQLAIKNINTQYIPTLSFVASGGYLFQSNDLKMANTNSWFDYSNI